MVFGGSRAVEYLLGMSKSVVEGEIERSALLKMKEISHLVCYFESEKIFMKPTCVRAVQKCLTIKEKRRIALKARSLSSIRHYTMHPQSAPSTGTVVLMESRARCESLRY